MTRALKRWARFAAAHAFDKFFVRFDLSNLIEQELHRVDRVHRMQDLTQDPKAVQEVLWKEHFFLTSRGLIDVQAREYALFHQLAIEVDFRIAGSFEFFENDFVHSRAGFNQRGRDNRERAAFFDISSSTKETLRLMKEALGVHTARQRSCPMEERPSCKRERDE